MPSRFQYLRNNSCGSLFSTFLASAVLCGTTVVLSGCTEESGVKTDTKITAPDGSSTRETREIKVDKKGENPPLAPPRRSNGAGARDREIAG